MFPFPRKIRPKRLKPTPFEEIECVRLAEKLRAIDGIYQEKKIPFGFTHIPNGGKRHIKVASLLKKMGTRAGVSDYLILEFGKPFCFLEMKHAPNKLSKLQQNWFALVQSMGGVTILAYSANEAIFLLKKSGYLTHATNNEGVDHGSSNHGEGF